MATFRPCLRKGVVNSKGESTVNIALSHHGKTAYISTDIKVKVDNWYGDRQVKGANKNEVNARILCIVNTYNERLAKISNADAKNVLQLKDAILIDSKQKYHKLSECFESYCKHLSQNSRESYKTAMLIVSEYAKEHDINIESIDCNYIKQYDKWLHSIEPYRTRRMGRNSTWKATGIWKLVKDKKERKTHYSQASINTFLAHLKAVINYCINEGWVKYDIHPFSKTEICSSKRRENIISPEEFYKIKSYVVTNPRYKKTHDMFLLSFYMGGANIADLLRIDFSNDMVKFERKKIESRSQGKNIVSMPVLPCAREIVDKYIGEDGKLKVWDMTDKNLNAELNYCIKCIALLADVDPKHVTFTSARKAFATIGTNLGISDNYLDYLMGHSMAKKRGMMNPYSVMDVAIAGEVLKTIVTISDHPDKINEIFKNKLNELLSTITD